MQATPWEIWPKDLCMKDASVNDGRKHVTFPPHPESRWSHSLSDRKRQLLRLAYIVLLYVLVYYNIMLYYIILYYMHTIYHTILYYTILYYNIL